jgi:hypothetical protein
MKTTHTGRTTTVLLLVLVSGPLSTVGLDAAPVPKEAPKGELYFPIKKGTKSVYTWGREEWTQEVTKVECKTREKVWVVTTNHVDKDGKLSREQEWEVSNQGLVMVRGWSDKDKDKEPLPRQFIKLPHLVGEKWAFGPLDGELRCVAGEKKRVKVPVGEFEAIRVET